MTCRSHQDALLDLARGVPQPAAIAQAAEEHLAGCEACRLELRRQRDLSASLEALSREARAWQPSPDAEARFLAAVARERSTMAAAAAFEPRRMAAARWRWIAAAAAAAIAIAGWLGARDGRPPGTPAVTTAATQPVRPPTASAPVAPKAEEPVSVVAAASRPPHRRATPDRHAAPRPIEFIQTPAAAALPPFESGSIVRLALAVSELPAYGVDIVPDAAGPSVEADVLVGQDGQIRGIRLVSSAQRSSEPALSRPGATRSNQ